jgi:tripartite-type tricarboxylate transporter receptor subunit TctC
MTGDAHQQTLSMVTAFDGVSAIGGQSMKLRIRATLASCLCTIVCLGVAGPASAGDYPNRTIKIVVPAPPGSLLDVVPRIIAEKLSAKWDVPVIIENRPGAAQNLGAEVVAKSDSDGYTLLASPPGPLAVSQHLHTSLNFDPAAFVKVSMMVTLPTVLVVNPKLPVANFEDFLAYARANPNKLNFGSPGVGSTPHLATEQLMKAAGIRLTHVPYQGMAPAMNDLIGGHIDVMIDLFGNALPNIREGKLKLLAVTAKTRMPELADVPAISEALPGYSHQEWFAIVAPPNTPADIATKLSAAIAEILRLPDVVKRLTEFAAVPVGGTPAETAAFVKAESDRWRELINQAGIKID